MRTILLLLVLSTAVIAGCSNAPPRPEKNPFDVQVELVREQQKQSALQSDAIAQMAASCKEDACRTQIALTIALTKVGGSSQSQIPQYVEKEGIGREVVRGLFSAVPLLGQVYLGVHQSNNSVKQSAQQYDFLSNVAANMKSDVHIEGGYIGGSVSGNGAGIGNSFAVTGTGNAIGDGNTLDNSQGQTNGNWNNNSGRAFSPGPYTGFNGGNCTSTGGDGGTTDPTGAGGAGNGAGSGDIQCNGGG